MAMLNEFYTERTRDAYPTRTAGDYEILQRRDPVVWPGAKSGPLPASSLDRFERDGFLLLPDVFSTDEVRFIREAVDALLRPSQIPTSEVICEPGSTVARSVFRVHMHDDRLSALGRDVRVAGVARQLLGGDVYIHQSRVNLKPPFDGREFQWHSDFETWHAEDGMPRMRALSASVLLDDNTTCNGPLMLVAGSHRHFVQCIGETPTDHYKRSLRRQERGVPPPEAIRRLADLGRLEAPTAKAGSVLFFDCNTLHASAGNLSPYPRTNAFFVYNSVHNRLVAPFAARRQRPEFIAARTAVAALEIGPALEGLRETRRHGE